MMTMNLELIKVLNEHLTVLSQLAEQKVAVYREINTVNRAIQMEIGAYTDPGVKVNIEYHAANNDVATWLEHSQRSLMFYKKLGA